MPWLLPPAATFGYFTEAKADSVMEGFKKLVPKKCKVLRDGHMVVLDAEELVPGESGLCNVTWPSHGG